MLRAGWQGHPSRSAVFLRAKKEWKHQHADCQPTRPQGSEASGFQEQDPCPRWVPAEAGCLHARLHDHPEKAEFGAPEGRPRPPDERDGDRRLHPRRGPQPPGALRGARPRRPRQGSAGLSLQDHPRRSRHGRRRGSQAGALEVRRQKGFELMPRRGEVQARVAEADAVYSSALVTQVINKVMLDGKKSIAESIVYEALEQDGTRHGRPPIEVLEQAVKTVTPVLEVKGRRVGGANYQVPVEVPQRRARTLAVRWLVTFARERREKGMSVKLANEIMDALNQQGGAFKRKDDVYRMAQANKAFAHYRW